MTVDEIKEKFNTLQERTQKLKEEKISLDSQLETYKIQYAEKLDILLKETGTSSLEEAIQFCNNKVNELEALKEELSETIDSYLKTLDGES